MKEKFLIYQKENEEPKYFRYSFKNKDPFYKLNIVERLFLKWAYSIIYLNSKTKITVDDLGNFDSNLSCESFYQKLKDKWNIQKNKSKCPLLLTSIKVNLWTLILSICCSSISLALNICSIYLFRSYIGLFKKKELTLPIINSPNSEFKDYEVLTNLDFHSLRGDNSSSLGISPLVSAERPKMNVSSIKPNQKSVKEEGTTPDSKLSIDESKIINNITSKKLYNKDYLIRSKIPKNIKSNTSLTSIERIFRDEDELPVAGSLSSQIDLALSESEYLICLCSPRYLESQWCMMEIETFIEKFGKDKKYWRRKRL